MLHDLYRRLLEDTDFEFLYGQDMDGLEGGDREAARVTLPGPGLAVARVVVLQR